MWGFWKRLFSRNEIKPAEIKLSTVNAGERWIFSPESHDPWGPKAYRPAIILEVRDGWVRYDLGAGGPFRDERKRIDEFMSMYRLAERCPDQ